MNIIVQLVERGTRKVAVPSGESTRYASHIKHPLLALLLHSFLHGLEEP